MTSNITKSNKPQTKLRAGCRWHNQKQVPEHAEIKKDKNGRECYLSGTFQKNGTFYHQLKYIDNDEFFTAKFDFLNPFFERTIK
jgi:hypothetical protein